MFAHRVKIQLKPNSFIELFQKNQNQLMPALRPQKEFCTGLTLIDTIWLTAIKETSWETKDDAEIYQRTGYPEALKILYGLTHSEPVTSIFEISDSGIKQSKKPVFAC